MSGRKQDGAPTDVMDELAYIGCWTSDTADDDYDNDDDDNEYGADGSETRQKAVDNGPGGNLADRSTGAWIIFT